MATDLDLENHIITRYKEGKDGSFRNFKCDICQSQMKVNRIDIIGMAYTPFTDDLGEHIHDDDNYTTATLVCENNHLSQVRFYTCCPNPRCDWVDDGK